MHKIERPLGGEGVKALDNTSTQNAIIFYMLPIADSFYNNLNMTTTLILQPTHLHEPCELLVTLCMILQPTVLYEPGEFWCATKTLQPILLY